MAALLIDDFDKGMLTQIHTAKVTAEDLEAVMGRPLTGSEKALLADFESSWKYFVHKKKDQLPSGNREMNLAHLEGNVEELTKTRDSVEAELKRQLAFFKESESVLEEDLRAKIQQEKQEYDSTEKELQEQLAAIEDAQALQEQTLPWTFFLSRVDAEADAKLGPMDRSKSRTIKPSQRAIYLTGKYYGSSSSSSSKKETKNDSDEILRRAFQVDHAILKAQLEMLNKQIQRYEKTIAAQESASLFLMENNVWSIME
eukprot:scaffold34688_cov234-Amphora_coffeaeformis.AAC.3